MLARRSMLIKGRPGSAKTTLGLQMLASAARERREAGIILTFEQIPEQLVADTAAFGWDVPALISEKLMKVFFVTPEEVLQNPGRQEHRLLLQVADWVEETGAARILIDSISSLRALYSGEEARANFMNFMLQLKELGLTPILTAEMHGDRESSVDVYLVDSVVHLNYQVGGVGQPDRRWIEIIKTRGHGHIPGAHPLELGAGGIKIFPHTYPSESGDGATSSVAGGGAAIPTGVRGLDRLLDGGYVPGSAILVAGLSGTFKSTLAGQFLLNGGERPALWITFHETADELARSFTGFGLDIKSARESGRLHFIEATPGRESAEKILHRAESIMREKGIERVVVDSPDELTVALRTADEKHEAVLWLLRRLRALGGTVLFTQRLTRATGGNPLSDIAMTDLADTIIYLGLVEIESRLEKVISVLKHRGGRAEGDLRSIFCTASGLEVSERFVGLSGVLAGTALGKRKAQIENIFQPLFFIRDFLSLAKNPSLDAERRAKILENLSGETAKLIDKLGQYFDEPTAPAKPPQPKEDPK